MEVPIVRNKQARYASQSRLFFTPRRLACFAILLTSVVVYLPVLQGMFILDDTDLVNGSAIGGGDTLAHCFMRPFLLNYYRPLVSASFFLENRLARQTPFFYHQSNILLHALTTGLLMLLLQMVFPARRRIALIGGLLFAVQPVQVGAVAWIGGRTDSLCALWMVSFAYVLVRAVRAEGRSRILFLGMSVAAYAGAILTKEQVLPALLLVPLAFRCFSLNSRQESRCVVWWSILPFILVVVAFLTMYVSWGPFTQIMMHRSLGAQLAQGGRTVTYYTLLLLLPAPRWLDTFTLGSLETMGLWSVLAGYLILVALLLLYRRWLRTEPAAAWFLTYVFLTLILVGNFIPLVGIVAASYRAGAAGVGAAALLGWMFGNISLPAAHHSRWSLSWRTVAGTALLVWSAGLTVWGAAQWQSAEKIFGTFVRYDPDSVWARYNLTTVLLNSGKTNAAIVQLEAILTRLFGSPDWRTPESAMHLLRTRPDIIVRAEENQGNQIKPRKWIAELYSQLGFAYLDKHNLARAQPLFRTGVEMNAEDVESNMGMGECAYRAGDYHSAKRWLSYAAAIVPSYPEAHIRLGQTYAVQGLWQAAYREYATCVRLQPTVAAGYIHLAEAQMRLGDRSGAEATLEKAARCTPLRDIARRMVADLRSNRTPNFDIM